MTRWLAVVSRLVAEDLRRLAVPVGLWILVLAGTGITMWPVVSLDNPANMAPLHWPKLFLQPGGPILAALFVLVHPTHPRAFWRTRPWSRGQVLAAKWLEVVGFVWLPAASLQGILLVGIGRFDLRWSGIVLDLIVTPGGWMLAGAALGALVRSFHAFLAASIAGVVAFFLFLSLALSVFPPLELEGPRPLVVLEATAAIVLTAAYLSSARRRVMIGGAVLFFAGWIGFAALPPSESPRVATPAESRIEVAALGPPSGTRRENSNCVSLCVDLVLDGVPEIEARQVRARGIFESHDGFVSARLEEFDWLESIGIESSPGRLDLDSPRVAVSCSNWFEEQRDARGDLQVEVELFGALEQTTADVPARTGRGLVRGDDSVSIDLVGIEKYDRSIWVRARTWSLERLLAPRDLTFFTPRLLVDGEVLEPEPKPLDEGMRFPSSARVLPFGAQALAWREPRWSFRFEDPRFVDRAEIRLRIDKIEWVKIDSVEATLENVTVGQLACDSALRASAKLGEESR